MGLDTCRVRRAVDGKAGWRLLHHAHPHGGFLGAEIEVRLAAVATIASSPRRDRHSQLAVSICAPMTWISQTWRRGLVDASHTAFRPRFVAADEARKRRSHPRQHLFTPREPFWDTLKQHRTALGNPRTAYAPLSISCHGRKRPAFAGLEWSDMALAVTFADCLSPLQDLHARTAFVVKPACANGRLLLEGTLQRNAKRRTKNMQPEPGPQGGRHLRGPMASPESMSPSSRLRNVRCGLVGLALLNAPRSSGAPICLVAGFDWRTRLTEPLNVEK